MKKGYIFAIFSVGLGRTKMGVSVVDATWRDESSDVLSFVESARKVPFSRCCLRKFAKK